MASLSDLVIGSAKQWAAKDIAGKEAEEKKKESFLSGLLALAKPAAAWGSKALLTAAGIGSGGILTPLLMGLGTAGISNIFDVIGRKGLKLGADPSKIEATGKYGYGKEYAKTTREGLEENIKERDPLSKESILGDVIGSYVSALTPKIVPGKDGGFTVEGGELLEAQKGKGFKDLLSKERLFGIERLPEMEKIPVSDVTELFSPLTEAPLGRLQGESMDLSISPEMLKNLPTMSMEDLPQHKAIDYFKKAEVLEESPMFSAKSFLQESIAPGEDQVNAYLYNLYPEMFEGSSMQPKQYQQGGQVSGHRGGGTISEYFGGKGMTLGGSNTQSLTEILAKRR